MSGRQPKWTWQPVWSLGLGLGLALMLAGCERVDRSGAGGAVKGAAGVTVEDPPGKTETETEPDGDVPPLPGDPVKVSAPSTAAAGGEILLSRTRYYRLDVETVDKSVLVTISRRWLFEDGFPEGLIAAVREHPRAKRTDSSLFDERDGKIVDSRYIRWDPTPGGSKAAALLLFVEAEGAGGTGRHELAISVDLELDATLGKARPKQAVAFDKLSVDLDLATGTLTGVRWAGKPLPHVDGDSETAEHTIDIRMTGTLTGESSANIRGADALLADDASNAFRSLSRIPFQNESHHGITLGWLGLDQLRHGLIVVPRSDGKLFDLQYSVSGESFDLETMRRQLDAASWPLVLRGRDYLGTSLSGHHVFQPVECLVSRQDPSAATKVKPKAAAPKTDKTKKTDKSKKTKK